MTTSTMEKIKVMLAFDEGKKIELRSFEYNSNWVPFTGKLPAWNWADYAYRITPQPPRKFIRWFLIARESGRVGPSFDSEEGATNIANHYVPKSDVVAFEMTEISQNAS